MMMTKNDTKPAGVKKQKPLRKANLPDRTDRNNSGALPASCSGTHPDPATCICFTIINFITLNDSRQAVA